MAGKALIFFLCNLFVLSSCSLILTLVDRKVFVNMDRLNWFQAFQTCRSRGQRLLMVKTPQENSILHEFCKANKVQHPWLDGSDLGEEGQWYWMNSGLKIINFFWLLNPRQPDNSGEVEHCLHIDTVLGKPLNNWNDFNCKATAPYICEELPSSEGVFTLNIVCGNLMFHFNYTVSN